MSLEQPASYVFRRVAGRDLPAVDHGQGAVLWDRSGHRYLDGSGGAVVVNIGHGRREVADAMARQAAAAAYVHGTQFTSDVLEEYARRLAPTRPATAGRLYLVSGGLGGERDRGEDRPRLAPRARRPARHKVIRRSVSYHGNTLATLVALGPPEPPGALPSRCSRARPRSMAPFCYHCPLGRAYPECEVACVDDLEAVIRREGPETVAAYIAEPILGRLRRRGRAPGGLRPPRAREICDRHGVLYIDDEVMTGFGRTGRWFAIEWSGVVPDIVTCGKGMSGGYMPVGACWPSARWSPRWPGPPAASSTASRSPTTRSPRPPAWPRWTILEKEGLVERARGHGRAGPGPAPDASAPRTPTSATCAAAA